jgi:hypothetical protein
MPDRNTLLAPPFAADPPVKLNISAKTLGLVLAILGAIGAVFEVLALLGLGALLAVVGGIFALALVGMIIGLIGTILSAWGGYQMYQLKSDGKVLVIYGLIVNVIGTLIASFGGSGTLVGWLVGALIAFAIYYFVVISRFPGEPPLVDNTPAKV